MTANSSLPRWMLLEDVVDLCNWYEAMGRAIPRTRWAAESIAAVEQKKLDEVF